MSTRWVFLVGRRDPRLRSVRAGLERAGYEVENTETIETALSCLAVMRPAMVVVDRNVRGLKRLREALAPAGEDASKRIPLITSLASLSSRRAARRSRASLRTA
jgi:ActR/RegA family two-component response regulator